MNQRHLCESLVIALPLLLAAALHAAAVSNLRCEYRENPLGIDVVNPRLSWVIEESEQRPEVRGQRQTAYQVLVASSKELLTRDKGDLWDSGKEESDQSIQVEYAGKALASRMHFADRVFPDGVHSSPIGNITISDRCVSFPRMGGGHNRYQTYHQTSEFVSAGAPGEEFCHKFNYAGFRHVVVEGLDTAPRNEDATALLVESALADTGSFECSDPLINRIHQVNRWTLRCLNLGSYIVDCPHRERMGYGDGQVSLEDHDSPYGRIVSNWKRDPSTSIRPGGNLTMEVTIPANTTATVHVPAKDAAAVTEGGNTIDKVKGAKFLRMENGAAVYAIGSGTYRFGSSVTDTVK